MATVIATSRYTLLVSRRKYAGDVRVASTNFTIKSSLRHFRQNREVIVIAIVTDESIFEYRRWLQMHSSNRERALAIYIHVCASAPCSHMITYHSFKQYITFINLFFPFFFFLTRDMSLDVEFNRSGCCHIKRTRDSLYNNVFVFPIPFFIYLFFYFFLALYTRTDIYCSTISR
ncbi:hypothetical protein PUN28_013707 [Cardiocondyla obscurior]|uniref:Uncharacterized protein n=1 Tax=Cardiocondyla obscurior TaxID=286306 RepID=A0AAW2F7T8_9HYME